MAIDCIVTEPAWEPLDPDRLAARCRDAAAAETASRDLQRTATALFTSDSEVRELNTVWRGKDKPTNVLSFPAAPMPGLPDDVQPLGDLALAYGVCVQEAREKGIGLHDHAAHLVVHGLLHLLGYDHIVESDAVVMEDLERRILQRLGIADPYAAGATR